MTPTERIWKVPCCQRFNPFSKTDQQKESLFESTQNNRLTKHHINLQVHLIVGKLNAALRAGWINISNWPGLQPLIQQIFLRSWSAVLNIWMTQRALFKHNLSNASACVRSHSRPVVRQPSSRCIRLPSRVGMEWDHCSIRKHRKWVLKV